MEKKLNIILIILGISAFTVGLIGMVNRDDRLLPVAGLLIIATGLVYGITLYIKSKSKSSK
jgi:hypothetical protein